MLTALRQAIRHPGHAWAEHQKRRKVGQLFRMLEDIGREGAERYGRRPPVRRDTVTISFGK